MIQGPNQNNIKLPSTSQEVYFSTGYRIPHTNQTLEEAGVNKDIRYSLFHAYDKDEVLKGVSIYFGATENTHRDKMSPPTPEHIISGLVATVESLRTRGEEKTESTIFGGEDIVDKMQEKYSDRQPALRIRSDQDAVRLKMVQKLVNKYISGNTE